MLSLEQLLAGVVVPIDKPRQWTSFQAVNKVKAAVRNLYGLKKFKIGHAGTLDPLATGLLLVCVGKATKSITPCYDLEQAVDHYYPYEHITAELLRQQAATLTGPILQVPPMFSAVKIDGQRAYEYARRDDPTVTIQPKPVTVYSFEITAFRPGQGPAGATETAVAAGSTAKNLYQNPLGEVPAHLPQADFRIHCGKGTYIRSLARDLGEALGSGAFLSALRREQVGSYTVDRALQLDQVSDYLTTVES